MDRRLQRVSFAEGTLGRPRVRFAGPLGFLIFSGSSTAISSGGDKALGCSGVSIEGGADSQLMGSPSTGLSTNEHFDLRITQARQVPRDMVFGVSPSPAAISSIKTRQGHLLL